MQFLIDGMSSREVARVFGVDPRTIAKMLAFFFSRPDTGAANLYDALRIPGYPAGHSDDIRPPKPGYPATLV